MLYVAANNSPLSFARTHSYSVTTYHAAYLICFGKIQGSAIFMNRYPDEGHNLKSLGSNLLVHCLAAKSMHECRMHGAHIRPHKTNTY
jgi:hypothetical protein